MFTVIDRIRERAAIAAIALAVIVLPQLFAGEAFAQNTPVTRQETLRGSVTSEREWWDVLHYDLSVQFLIDTRAIKGSNVITFKALKPGRKMQIDLQQPLAITKIKHGTAELKYEREGNVYWVSFEKDVAAGVEDKIEVLYEGNPRVSTNPPWSGGITWGRDDLGDHFITTTCQGIGASIWWPNKDHGSDEPDRGMRINITVPQDLVAVSNGRLKSVDTNIKEKTKTYHWQVTNPINNYGVNANIGKYVTWSEKYRGEGGMLDVSYWVLGHQKLAAMKQFKEVPRMLKAFESWFGKYPFYEDGYKLVAVSYAGMEHQSSVTYGNWYRNGYRGRDVSFTGIGYKFDFIIVHESGHEWFGNNISMKDAADMWIHEGFTNYSENLFVEYWFGKKAGEDYVIGSRRNIGNNSPIIGTYGTNREGSGDMYYKGGNLLHTIRNIVNDDIKWRAIMRGLNKEFWHQTVTTAQVENYISREAGVDLSKVFDQYLRGTRVPLLQYKIEGDKLSFKYDRVVNGFSMPTRISINGTSLTIKASDKWQSTTFPATITTVAADRNFYIESEQVK